MNGYYIEPFGPDQVNVHEHEVSYPMTRATAEANLEHIKAHHENYIFDDDWLRRVNFYEDILAAMPSQGGE